MRSLFRVASTLLVLGLASAIEAQDPVDDFIVRADSLATAAGDEALAVWLQTHPALVGAAIGQLVETALQLGDAGDVENERGNLDFADKVAAAHHPGEDREGFRDYLRTVRAWDADARAKRQRALALDDEARGKQGDGELDAAVEVFAQARAIYEELHDLRSLAVLYGSLGVVHWYRADWQAVEDSYVEALRRRREIDDRILEGRTLNGLGSLHYAVGDPATALGWYEQAAATRRSTGDLSGLGSSLGYAANCHVALGHPLQARQLYDAALPVLEKLGQQRKVVETLDGIANLQDQMGRLRESEATRREAIRRAPDAEASDHLPLLHLNLADTLRRQGRAQEALAEVDAARTALEAAPNPSMQQLLDRIAGDCYRALGDRDAARDHFVASVQAARESGENAAIGEALVNLATLYVEFEAPARAVSVAEEALALARGQEDGLRQRDALNVLGTAQQLLGEHDAAIVHLRSALEIDEREQREFLIPDDRAQLGATLSRAGQLEEAREQLRRSLAGFVATDREPERWVALLAMGDSHEQSDPDSAAYWYERTLDVLEQSRRSVASGGLNAGYLSTRRGVALEGILHFAAQQALRAGGERWLQRTFEVAERSRAAGLADLLDLAAQESDPETSQLLDAIYAQADDVEARRAAEAEYARHLSQRRRNMGWSSERPTLRALRKSLGRDALFVEYAVTDSASWAFVSDRKKTELFRLPPRADLADPVRRLHDALARPGTEDAQLRALATQLYEQLVAPFAERLRGKKRLIVSPDDALHELPFELLLPEDSGGALGALPWLGRDLEIGYAPSASLALRERARGGGEGVLALGGPQFSAQPPRASGAVAALEPLPFAQEEVENLGRYYAAGDLRVFTGAVASEGVLREQLRTGPPRVLHLATHGLVDARQPNLSCVALAPDRDDDGYLYTLEILDLPLDAELVVLSACESGRGRIERGEGVVGLTRSFLASGARSVLCSLWPVSDRSTATLMDAFYAEYARGSSAPAALRDARRELIADPATAHPFHWAAFVWIGGLGD